MVIDLTAQLEPVFWGMMLLAIASVAAILMQAEPPARRPKNQLQHSPQLAHAKSAI